MKQTDLDKLFDHPEVKAFLADQEQNTFPMIEGSAMTIVVCDGPPDARMAIQLGAALLFEKPIVLAVNKVHEVPAKLLRIADVVVSVEDWKANPEKVQKRLTEVTMRYPKGKRT